MMQQLNQSSIVTVEAHGALDESEGRRVADEVCVRATENTALIIVSLAGAPEIHWNALCGLRSAAERWQTSGRDVIFEAANPSQRFLLASILRAGTARTATA